MTVFKNLAKAHPTAFAVHMALRDSEMITAGDYVSFPDLSDVLVSRWYPGYRVTDLTGPNADESIAILLGEQMQSVSELDLFRMTLATPHVAADIIQTLFPRPGVPIKGRTYQVSEEKIAEVCEARLSGVGLIDVRSVALSYTYAITRVLSSRGLVTPTEELKIVKTASSYALNNADLRRALMVDGLRGIFSETRIQSIIRHLDQDATPLVLGEVIGKMFREFSKSLPEAILRLQQYNVAMIAQRRYNTDPKSLPLVLSAHKGLQQLASIANFTVYASEELDDVSWQEFSNDEIAKAIDAVLVLVRSMPSIETIPLKSFNDYFGEVPASTPDGFRRGLVLYSVLGQKSTMEVADVYPLEGNIGARVAAVDPAYVRSAGLATTVSSSLLTPSSVAGLANIVADEMALQKVTMDDDCRFDPELLTIQVTDQDLLMLALARADSVSYVTIGSAIEGRASIGLVFDVSVAEQWRMNVLSATPNTASFMDPASVIIYTSEMMAREPKTLPARAQTIGLQVLNDKQYFGDMEQYFVREVCEPFTLQVPLASYGDEITMLKLEMNVLGSLVGYNGKAYNRGTAYYAAVREPGVDVELQNILRLALAYAEQPASDVNGDKARGWLVVRLAPLMMHPSVRGLAERAVTRAILNAKIDGRRLAPQLREVYARAFFGTALVILNRFGKIDGSTVTGLTKAVPTSTLSVQAALTLAQLPGMIMSPTTVVNA